MAITFSLRAFGYNTSDPMCTRHASLDKAIIHFGYHRVIKRMRQVFSYQTGDAHYAMRDDIVYLEEKGLKKIEGIRMEIEEIRKHIEEIDKQIAELKDTSLAM